ncbi:TerC family protein [Almyronema epifaneia]|uniref:TerC family protein n=1 Tax=Almyronema epifaneia S1 TaxID=2991925 RepID=A0ABW6IDF9_9CYAN
MPLDRLLEFSPNVGVDTLLLLPVLIALEAVLSADNAIALAAIAQGLASKDMERRALNVGLVVAFLLRVCLILTAGWVLQFWQFEVLGAVYLLWLVYQYFTSDEDDDAHHHGPRFQTVWQAVPLIALTDLAFSLDSVTTAIALSQEIWLVLLGGAIGVITLRFMAELFIGWLEVYVHLEDAGFATVALVGIRLLIRVVNENWVPPEWLMVSLIAALFAWGFSKKRPTLESEAQQQLTASDREPVLESTHSAAQNGQTTHSSKSADLGQSEKAEVEMVAPLAKDDASM